MSLRSQITSDLSTLFAAANLGDPVTYRDADGAESSVIGAMNYGDPESKPAVIHDGYLGEAQWHGYQSDS